MEIRILTPGGILWAGKVIEVSLPTMTGEIGILKNHASLLTALEIGVVRFRLKDLTVSEKFKTKIVKLDTLERQWAPLFVREGTAKIKRNIIQVITNKALLGTYINFDFVSNQLNLANALVLSAQTKKEKIIAVTSFCEAKAYAKAIGLAN